MTVREELMDKGDAKRQGEPVQIVSIDDKEGEHRFYLNEEALQELFLDPEIKDKPVCIVSIAGGFRRGKSFLLDFLLRYLTYQSTASNTCSASHSLGNANVPDGDWLGDPSSPLLGFHWSGGSERDTTGILMWSKPFVMRAKDGSQVAVILMDTQGTFDSKSTVLDSATIFALSAIMSSVLVYNLRANIEEEDLRHLEVFTGYGLLALQDSGETPFQKLHFLVRDWSYPYEAPYGHKGGQQMVKHRLEITEDQHHKMQDLRRRIHSCFTDIDGFLLPHPGLRVATDPDFKGQIKDIEPLFLENLGALAPLLLSSEKLLVKKIGGNVVKCRDVVDFFRAYMDMFRGDEIPEPPSMFEAISEANNNASLNEARDAYNNMMNQVCGKDKPYINEHILELEHERVKERALEIFEGRRKMGGEEFSAKYRNQLDEYLQESYENFMAINEGKNIFKAANTPITLASIAMILYLISELLSLFALYSFANLLNLFMVVTFLMLAMWSYSRYTGNLVEIGAGIDDIAKNVWEQGFQPVVSKMLEEGSQYVARKAVERMNSTASNSSAEVRQKRIHNRGKKNN